MMKNPESATVQIRYERGKSNMKLVLLGTSRGVSKKRTGDPSLPLPRFYLCRTARTDAAHRVYPDL